MPEKNYTFTTKIQRPSGVGTWHYASVPIDAEKEFGKKGQVKVKAVLNGIVFYNSLLPRGNGSHYIVLGGDVREKAGVRLGDTITLTISKDNKERTVEIPTDFKTTLSKNKTAQANFNKLAYSYRKEYITWVTEAKREETRKSRITASIAKLKKGEKLR